MKKTISVLLAVLLTIAYFTVPVRAAEKDEVDTIISSIPANWPAAPSISAKAAILMDASSGEILYAKDATQAMYPASTTKLMTALLALENSASLDEIVDFPFAAVNIPAGSSHIGMRRGEQMVLRECLYGLLLPSANEVANALGLAVSGSLQDFVIRMNERAYQLGAVNTVFSNANGLHEDTHFTCAYDLALIMKACVQNSTFVEIASSLSYVHHADSLLNKDIPMTNTDLMIRSSSEYYNPYVICGKTGHTAEAGYNLVTYAEKDGMKLITAVLCCQDGGQYVSTQSLLDYGFNYFRQVLPAELDTSLSMEHRFTSSPLALPTPDISLLSIASTDTILLPDSVTFDMLTKNIENVPDGLRITYTYENYPLGSVLLSGSSSLVNDPIYREKAAEVLTFEEVENLSVIDGWLIVTLAILILVFILYIILLRSLLLPKKKLH